MVKVSMETGLAPTQLYMVLQKSFGIINWWPVDKSYHEMNNSDPRFEIIVGAVLTQNTAWSNVEKALDNLKLDKALDVDSIMDMTLEKLEELVRPSGFFKQKAKRLKNLVLYLKSKYNGDLDCFFNRDFYTLREELLSLSGIGPETADSILLYAGGKPVFVVDAYTKRVCERLPVVGVNDVSSYDTVQRVFQYDLSKNFSDEKLTMVYKELHALIVELAKKYCKKKPLCSVCPLNNKCLFKKNLF